jgi:GTP cyclohydrolase II
MNITPDQAIHELKRGRAVNIGGKNFAHPEYIDELSLKKLKNPKLIITAMRASAIFGKKILSAVEIDVKGVGLGDLLKLIQGKPKKMPTFKPNNSADKALKFAARAELLPTLLQFETKTKLPKILNLKSSILNLKLVTTAPLKLRDCKQAKIYAFRSTINPSEHLAIVVGEPKDSPLVRVHSCCYTGDLLGSITCDCNDQLRGALKLMDKNGGGVLIYLMQEGRGIGLINKLKAYQLQSEGMDTVEANEFLGFDDEERAFAPAVEILKKLKIKKIRLISNNPKKAKELEAEGIKVSELVPMIIKHEHNQHYLATKAKKSGHIIK